MISHRWKSSKNNKESLRPLELSITHNMTWCQYGMCGFVSSTFLENPRFFYQPRQSVGIFCDMWQYILEHFGLEGEKMRVVVTGGAGFIGGTIIPMLLEKGHHILISILIRSNKWKNEYIIIYRHFKYISIQTVQLTY